MKTAHTFALTTLLLSGVCLVSSSVNADNRPAHPPTTGNKPPPMRPLFATFDCGVTINPSEGITTITHSNDVAVSKTTPVIATVKTPNGTTGTVVCGSAFESQKTAKISFVLPAVKPADKDWIYTCTAKLGTGECPKIIK